MAQQKGKYAEGKVRDFLKAWSESHAHFTFNRLLDAHAAGGMISVAQPGDFQWFFNTGLAVLQGVTQYNITRNGLIEVKEVEDKTVNGSARLPYKNMGVDQVGRMTVREMAGSECIVLVCHRRLADRSNIWRKVPLEFLRSRPGPESGSWDLSDFDAATTMADFLEPYLS